MINNISNYFLLPVFLIPILLITGPALPDTIISLFAIFFVFKFLILNKYRTNKLWFYFALMFYIGAVISSLFAYDFKIHSLSSSLPYIRFILFCLFLTYFVLIKPLNYFILINIIGILLFFVSIDICIQYFFGNDIFGFSSTPTRNAGPFGDELKGGSFISKLFIPTFAFFYFLSFKINYYKILSLSLFICCFAGIILSGERSALIIFVLSNILFSFVIIVNSSKKFFFIFLFSVFIILIGMFFVLNEKIKERYFVTTLKDLKNFESIIDSHYGAHYITAYNIFLDYPILGVGQNNFRNKCADDKYSNLKSKRIDDRCSTHPHNYYIQILSDLGFINFFLFIFFIYFLFYEILKQRNDSNQILFNGKLIAMVVIFWPLLPTGSFYNNWNSALNWLVISLSICVINKDYLNQLLNFLKNKKEQK